MIRHLMAFTRPALLVVAMAAMGAFTTVTVHAVISAQPVAAHCEDDECEKEKKCQDNPGGNTNCSFSGSKCKTSGCEAM